MSISSLLLRSGVASLACLSLLAPGAAASYILEDNFSGSTFFSNFDFFTASDPTHGFVNYVDQATAQSKGLLTAADGSPATFGVDHTSVLNATGTGRTSVRLSSKKTYTHALIISDIQHMPGGICGTWPAHWTLGPNWPYNGEIDIIEGVNDAAYNIMSLHTSNGCTIAGSNQTGTLQTNNCNSENGFNNNVGCGSTSTTSNSYGSGFNGGQGGVYATEWTSNYIRIWYFPRGGIPADITAGTPDPTGWGLPAANMQGSCTIDSHFANHQIIFDTTFCGDYAGSQWGGSCQSAANGASCTQFVASNPSAFANAYWSVNSVKVYQQVVSPSSSSASSTARLTSATPQSSVLAPGMGGSSTTSGVSAATSAAITASGLSNGTATTGPYLAATKSSALAGATAPATIGSFSYLGCASSNNRFSTFTQVDNSPTMSLDVCLAECSGYAYAGVYNTLCYCANTMGSDTTVTPGQGQCANPCPGNLLEFCGGTVAPSKKMIRQVTNNVLLSVYQNSNAPAAAAPLASAAPANLIMGYGMGGSFGNITTIVASTRYINVCNTCPGGYTTLGYTTIIEECGCMAKTAAPVTAVPMTAITTVCSACGPNGAAATVTVTVPLAVAAASSYAALPTVTVTSLPADQQGAISTYTAGGSTITAIVTVPAQSAVAAPSPVMTSYVSAGTTYTTVVVPAATAQVLVQQNATSSRATATVQVVRPTTTSGLTMFTGGAEKVAGSVGALGVVLAAAMVLL